jgi:hypothetical protein
LDISFTCLFRVIRVLLCVFWVFIAESSGVGDRRKGHTIMVDVQALLEAFLNMSVRYSCFINKAFFW